MSRKLNINIPGNLDIVVKFKKFSWSDIYGSRKTVYRTEDGSILSLVSLTLDGEHMLPLGSVSQQYINNAGEYLAKKDVIPADEEGKPLPVSESMFTTGVKLTEIDTISLEDYFYYEIEATYILESEDDMSELLSTCKRLLKESKLLSFQYAYYPTAYPLTGILLPYKDNIVIAVGELSEPIFLGPDTNLSDIFEVEDEEEVSEFEFERAW